MEKKIKKEIKDRIAASVVITLFPLTTAVCLLSYAIKSTDNEQRIWMVIGSILSFIGATFLVVRILHLLKDFKTLQGEKKIGIVVGKKKCSHGASHIQYYKVTIKRLDTKETFELEFGGDVPDLGIIYDFWISKHYGAVVYERNNTVVITGEGNIYSGKKKIGTIDLNELPSLDK